MWHFLKNIITRKKTFSFPKTKGEIRQNVPLAKKTWMGVGGNASYYFEPEDEEDLAHLIKYCPQIPILIFGGGSNIIVRDGGVPGLTIHLGKPFTNVKRDGDDIVCGAGLLSVDLSRFAQKNGLSGFEFLCGIPGTVGGALRMNAGAYGSEIKSILKSIRFVDSNGQIEEIEPQEDFFKYRKNGLPDDWIFTGAVFKGIPEKPEKIAEKMAEFKAKREANQPVGVKTCGSTFKNPDGLKAWELIDKAGCRGLTKGDACVSEKHTNFLINKGKATAADVEKLGEEVRKRVFEKSGVLLEWEIKRVGVFNKTVYHELETEEEK